MILNLVVLIVLQATSFCLPASIPQRAVQYELSQRHNCGCQSLCPNLPNYNPNCCNTNVNRKCAVDYQSSENCKKIVVCPNNCKQNDCTNTEKPECKENCVNPCDQEVVPCEEKYVTINYEGEPKCFSTRFKDTCSNIESVVSEKIDKMICFARGLMKKLNLAMDVRVSVGTDCEPEIAVRITHPLCVQLHKNCKLYVERPNNYGGGYEK